MWKAKHKEAREHLKMDLFTSAQLQPPNFISHVLARCHIPEHMVGGSGSLGTSAFAQRLVFWAELRGLRVVVDVLGAVVSSGELVCRLVQHQGILHGAFWKALRWQSVFNDAKGSGMQGTWFLFLSLRFEIHRGS